MVLSCIIQHVIAYCEAEGELAELIILGLERDDMLMKEMPRFLQ
jgi:hypothetical protein